MSNNSRKIVIEVDAKLYSLLKEYSDYSNQSEEDVLNRLIDYSLKEYADKYTDLKQGYIEMGKINLEISNAFTDSENEAFDQIID